MRADIWEARRQKIAMCAYMGMTISEASEETGFSTITVRTYAAKFGIKFPSSDEKVSRNSLAKYQALADEGLTTAEAAERLGLHKSTVFRNAMMLGVKFKSGLVGHGDPDRVETMASMFKAGKTLEEIGSVFRVTRERVRQLLKRDFGITGKDGGQSTTAKLNRDRRRAEREAECYRVHGCSTQQLNELRKMGRAIMAAGGSRERTPIGAFSQQRCSARSRGIEWNLRLWDWWSIWQESGHWADRGRGGDAYVMCRFGDRGPYEIGNVYVSTHRHNCSVQPNNPYRRDHPDFEQAIAEKRARAEERRAA